MSLTKIVSVSFSAIILSSAEGSTLSLEAHEIGTGDARVSNWETDYGSYDRDFSRSKKILVTLHNISRKPAPFAITVYFVAKPTVAPNTAGYDARNLFIYDRREHAGEFHDEIELKGSFSSRTLTANVQHYQALGVESASGADMIGWIVAGWSDGRSFGVAASSQELLQLAGSSERFENMIADYDRDHPSTLTAVSSQRTHGRTSEPKEVDNKSSALAQTSQPKPSAEFVTLTKPVEISIAFGKTKLPVGTRLQVVSRSAKSINAVYFGETIVIPLDSAR